MNISNKSRNTFLRLSEEEKSLLEAMARYYGITKADVIRIALKEFATNHGFYIDKTRHELFAKKEALNEVSS
jgi:predicted DNA-binding protein